MRFFVDTANVEEIRKANDMGIICGVTTNPSLIAKEGRDFGQVIEEIASIVDGPISGEVKATTVDADGMVQEGREIAAIHPNIVVKIPMTMEDWSKRLDVFFEFNEEEILRNKGKVSAEIAKSFAVSEFKTYRMIQDRLYQSDFDK